MAQITLLKFTFRENKKQSWLDWCSKLETRTNEVLETLRQEGVMVEACFVSERGNACYFLMEAESLAKVYEVFEKSNAKIDVEYKQKMEEALQFTEKLKPLYYFRQP